MAALRTSLMGALLVACVASAMGARHLLQTETPVYRFVVINEWNTSLDRNLTVLGDLETKLVKGCQQHILRGIIGPSENPFGADTASYAKVYDFETLQNYTNYVACFNNQTDSSLADAYITWKSRFVTMVNMSSSLPVQGSYVLASLANVTISPENFTNIRSNFIMDFSCLWNTSASYSLDTEAAAIVKLKTPSTNSYWINFLEPAMALAFEAANTGIPATNTTKGVPKYSVNGVIRTYYNITRPGGIPSDHLEFIAQDVKM